MTKLNLDKMNASQREAAEWQNGPLLVLAGPGSGKTYVLTMRVARIISHAPDSRFKVLGLTFTTKAADEMGTRVSELLGPDARRAHLTTFHSFAAKVLRQHGSHFGLRPDFKILSQDADRYDVLNEAIKVASCGDLPRTANGKSIAPVMDFLLREGHQGDEAPLPFSGRPRSWVRPVYKTYLRLLGEANYLDFGALLVYSLRLFGERPRLAQHYRKVYPFVCVDEYQDTNAVQDKLLRCIYPNPDANLFVVADDDQALYQWNGANPARLRELQADYQMKVVQLPECYRCPASVVQLANNLIRQNLDRTADKKPLSSVIAPSDQENIAIHRFVSAEEEMAWVAQDIVKRQLSPSQCTILARRGKLLEQVAHALKEAKLSPYLVERKQEFKSPLLRFVHAALRLGNKPSDTEQLVALCAAFHDLTGQDVVPEDVEAEGCLCGGDSLLGAFADVALMNSTDSTKELLCILRALLVERLKYREFVAAAFNWRGRTPTELKDEDDERRVWMGVDRSVRGVLGRDPSLSQFLQECDLRQKLVPPKPDDIQCLTIHLAKGKEFRHVYLVGLVEDELPSYHAVKKGGDAIEEERRNCFVAITRAQTSLTLTYAGNYFGYRKKPSRFLAEMGLEVGNESAPMARRRRSAHTNAPLG